MWRFIEASYKQLSEADKKFVEIEAKPFGRDPRFVGFDGNNESDYMSTASFIVNQLDRFEEFKGRDFNSHCPLVDAYRRMLFVFEEMNDGWSFELLNAEQLVKVLKEKFHPDNRGEA